MNDEGDNYGTTYQKSSPAITFPKKASGANYGKKTKSAPAYGGNQYGVTIQKSSPAVNFPASKPAFLGGATAKRGY